VSEPAEGRTIERLGLAGLLLVTLIVWILQFQPFDLPNNDYPSFEVTARAFAAGELPARFQRMPILPGLMALLAPVLPGPHPYLTAALVLNLAFSLALLVALYALAERLLGRGALLVPALFSASNQFHSMGLQPLVEPSLGFFVVMAIGLCARRSPWQYAAAGAAALSRYEAALLIGVLGLVNWLGDRAFLRHFVPAVLAGVPFLVWLALGAVGGSGATWYVGEMEGAGFSATPNFFLTALKEPLRGLLGSGASGWTLFALAAGAPIALGVASGARRFPREAAAMLLTFGLAVATIVVFGIDKGRYAYAYQWIPLFFLAAGLLWLLDVSTLARLARLPRAALTTAAVAAAAAALFLLQGGTRRLIDSPAAEALALDLVWAAAALAAVALALILRARTAGPALRSAALVAALVGLLVSVPLVAEGMRVKRKEQYKILWGNHGVVLAADWVRDHARDEDRFVVLHKRHYLHRTGMPPERFAALMSLEATSLDEVPAEMRAKGLTHLIVTWRKPPRQAIDDFYERKFKWFLIDPLLRGETVAGLTLVATLPLPEHLERPPVRIYRVE
jgi:hypothetical protein